MKNLGFLEKVFRFFKFQCTNETGQNFHPGKTSYTEFTLSEHFCKILQNTQITIKIWNLIWFVKKLTKK